MDQEWFDVLTIPFISMGNHLKVVLVSGLKLFLFHDLSLGFVFSNNGPATIRAPCQNLILLFLRAINEVIPDL